MGMVACCSGDVSGAHRVVRAASRACAAVLSRLQPCESCPACIALHCRRSGLSPLRLDTQHRQRRTTESRFGIGGRVAASSAVELGSGLTRSGVARRPVARSTTGGPRAWLPLSRVSLCRPSHVTANGSACPAMLTTTGEMPSARKPGVAELVPARQPPVTSSGRRSASGRSLKWKREKGEGTSAMSIPQGREAGWRAVP